MRRFLALTGGLILTFALLMVGVRAIDVTNPSPAVAILDPGNCSQPCWHGIQPGKTTFGQIKTLLRTDNGWFIHSYDQNHSLEWYMIASPDWYGSAYRNPPYADNPNTDYPVQAVQLFFPEGSFQLHSAIALWGRPTAILLCSSGILWMFFKDNIEIMVSYDPDTRRIDPSSFLISVIYDDPSLESSYRLYGQNWYGFTQIKQSEFC
ncbi:MAG: hypothetical protein IT324_09865 [Anaerolineae bacterium]|nr:hypothetical protein [Anaerolineae bacterium]